MLTVLRVKSACLVSVTSVTKSFWSLIKFDRMRVGGCVFEHRERSSFRVAVINLYQFRFCRLGYFPSQRLPLLYCQKPYSCSKLAGLCVGALATVLRSLSSLSMNSISNDDSILHSLLNLSVVNLFAIRLKSIYANSIGLYNTVNSVWDICIIQTV